MGNIFPEAMICFLENNGYEKFSKIYLGEYDTPEVIWSSEMKRHMIEKVAGHLADYSPRLRSNTRALYQFCQIPVVTYPQLENELFCNVFYLRHLCDEQKFADWPVQAPIELIKDCLMCWRREIDKKSQSMSRDQAYEILQLRSSADEGFLTKKHKTHN